MAADSLDQLTEIVLQIFRDIYGEELSDDEILEAVPYDYDGDTQMFVDMLDETLKVSSVDDDDEFALVTMTVQDFIDAIAPQWSGDATDELADDFEMDGFLSDDLDGAIDEDDDEEEEE